jgi:hypothetical protein
MLADGEVDKGLHIGTISDIQGLIQGVAAFSVDLGAQALQAVGAPRAKHDASALGGQEASGGFADAAAGAGDQDDFV